MATVPYSKIAEIGLSIIATAHVPATDEALALAQGVRQMLKAIVSGQLLVVEPNAIRGEDKPKPKEAK